MSSSGHAVGYHGSKTEMLLPWEPDFDMMFSGSIKLDILSGLEMLSGTYNTGSAFVMISSDVDKSSPQTSPRNCQAISQQRACVSFSAWQIHALQTLSANEIRTVGLPFSLHNTMPST